MSVKTLIQNAAIAHIQTNSYVSSHRVGVCAIGGDKVPQTAALIFVGCLDMTRIFGPLWRVTFVLRANVSNAHDPVKATLDELDAVIMEAMSEFVAQPSLLNTAGQSYNVDGVDDTIRQPPIVVGEMFTTRFKAAQLGVSYNDNK